MLYLPLRTGQRGTATGWGDPNLGLRSCAYVCSRMYACRYDVCMQVSTQSCQKRGAGYLRLFVTRHIHLI